MKIIKNEFSSTFINEVVGGEVPKLDLFQSDILNRVSKNVLR